MKKLLAILAIMVGALALSTPASAHSTPVGGQFCGTKAHNTYAQDASGHWLRCSRVGQSNVWKWFPSASPSASASASASKSTGPKATPTALPSSGAPSLPVTGPNATIYGLGAAGMLAVGTVLFVKARRRRVRFEA